MINLLMFDLDGTLFDTAPGIANAFNNLLKERGEPPVSTETVTKYIGTGLKDLLSQLDAELAHRLGPLENLENDFHRHYRAVVIEQSPLYPGLIDFLKTWRHSLAVVSNKNEYYVRELITKTELKQFKWTSLIGGNSFPVKKPHPRPLQEAMRDAGVQPKEALMIGDGLPDVVGAKNARVKSVAISFGYTRLSDLIHNGADATINHYQELPKVIHSLTSI